MHLLYISAFVLVAVTGARHTSQRIVGGSVTEIQRYPFGAALLFTWNGIVFNQSCGGSILNHKCLLSAAHCFVGFTPIYWRVRVGSTYANSGGVIHNTRSFVNHPSYNPITIDNDIAILRIIDNFIFNNSVRPGSFAGANYNILDNTAVWAIGWGRIYFGGMGSPQLRHVQVWTVNQNVCRSRYAELGRVITDNMLCSGWLDVGGRDQCQGDSGGPLLHNNVVVGVCSWGEECALPRYPGVNVRVSRYSAWIQNNA